MRLALVALALLTVAVYWPGLHGPFVYDDWHHVANNDFVIGDQPISLTQTARALTLGSFRANYRFWGADTFSFHVTNLMFHLLNGFLLFELAAALGLSAVFAIFAVGAFWLHPLNAEAVLYISGRSELMATMGILGSSLGLIRRKYIIAVLYALFGIFSKEIAFVIPILWLLVIERFNWAVPRWVKWLPVLCFALICALYSKPIADTITANGIGLPSEAYAVASLLCRVLIPYGLTPDHDFYHGSPYLMVIALMILGLWPQIAWLYRQTTSGFAALWIWVLLIPHLFVEPAGYLAEHHLHGPFVGVSLLLALGAERLVNSKTIPLGENACLISRNP